MKDEYSLEARLYDRVWGKYDYNKDVKFLDSLFRKHDCRSILDVGCGTGNHSIGLSKLGYTVTGVDLSLSMLKMARKKKRASKVTFIHGDMKNIEQIVPKKRRFDGAICLGHVFYHLMTDKEVLKFLSGLRRKLKEGGLFVFNVRNAKRMNEKYLNVLRLDHMVDEKKLQVAVFSHNLRDSRDPNVLLWRPIYFVKENEKMDFQVREHRLRWFKFLPLKKLIEKSDYEISAVYSGPAKEKFRENEHDDMWFITVTK